MSVCDGVSHPADPHPAPPCSSQQLTTVASMRWYRQTPPPPPPFVRPLLFFIQRLQRSCVCVSDSHLSSEFNTLCVISFSLLTPCDISHIKVDFLFFYIYIWISQFLIHKLNNVTMNSNEVSYNGLNSFCVCVFSLPGWTH